jgi:transposase
MARAYSDDLRGKVLAAYAAGKGTFKELAERFDVSYGWVAKIHAVERRTGSRARPLQSRRGRASAVDTGLVRKLVGERPDLVLRELQQALGEAGKRVSISHLARVLGQLGLRLKKSRFTPPSATRRSIESVAKPSSKPSGRSRPKT